MAAERTLVDGAVGIAAERHAGMFELIDRLRRFAPHIFDRVLVTEPVRPLDGVLHMPLPMVGRIVYQAGGDAAPRREGLACGWEHLGDAGVLTREGGLVG